LFESQVSALRSFKLLSVELENPLMRKKLSEIGDDLQSGMSISQALNKHPSVFSGFYVNMVRSGEESGKLSETFAYLADYLERTYELTSKVRGALAYPAFVFMVFIVIMVLLMTKIVPQLADMLKAGGQELPVYTKIIIGISDFMVNYGLFFLVVLIMAGVAVWRYSKAGVISFSAIKLKLPLFGDLFRKIYLARISDNMYTMLSSGIPMIKSIEISANVVGNDIYKKILEDAADAIKTGNTMSSALVGYKEIPAIMIQMIKVGEETGQVANILQKLAKFYRREVDTSVETLISLIEPILMVFLGLGVGIVLAAVLIPIYDIAGGIN
ncbi:MAG: type II secretion system F family protein, partial [bacterium]|nr:type II secretion system F family protein [bacterium]